MKTIRFFRHFRINVVLISLIVIVGCSSDNGLLTPARKIIGTWKTSMPVQFNIETNYCTGSFNLVATENRTVTFVITKGSTDSDVNIQMSFVGTDFTRTAFTNTSCIGGSTGYIPEVSPSFYSGTISGVNLTVDGVGTFSFTTDNMMGTYDRSSKGVFDQRVYTGTNQLKLYKQ